MAGHDKKLLSIFTIRVFVINNKARLVQMKMKATHILFLFVLLSSCRSSDRVVSLDQEDLPHPLLLVSIDGFMNEYMERNKTPNLDRLKEKGVLAEGLLPVFPTKTYPTHYSIVTGLYTENHGIISNRFYDDVLDAWFSYGPPSGDIDEGKWWGGEPIWVTAEKQSRTTATVFWPGSDSQIQGIRPTRYLEYDGSIPVSARIDTVMKWMDPAGEVRADFGTLYFSIIDNRGHRYGPDSPEVDEAVQWMDEWIGNLVDKIEMSGLNDLLNLMIVSDHGMAGFSGDHIIYLEEIIDLEDIRIIEWSPVAMLQPVDGKKDSVYTRLKKNERGYKVYLKEDLPEVYRFKDHYRIPEIIMIVEVPYTITTRQYHQAGRLLRGYHGYDHRSPEMQAFFLANGPSFREDEIVNSINSIHLYELMSHLLDIEPAPNDGSLDSLKHLLH